MRFFTILSLLGSLLLLSGAGCRNASIQCQRETALLRAEILDLEDKYYALKSQHERGSGLSSGSYITNNVIGSGVIEGVPMVVDAQPYNGQINGQIISGDVIYEDQMVTGAPMLQLPNQGVQGVQGEVYYDSQTPTMAAPVQSWPQSGGEIIPTPAAEPADLNLADPPMTPSPTQDDQTLVLPDSPALEVGFEELELNMSDAEEVDRIEIVSSSTRGKDLDGIAGHDGIEVMVQSMNLSGEPVDETGELTIVVRDNLVGEIGKWTFLPKELKLFLSRDELGNMGTLLHLPWTDRIPVSKQVEVRVSMIIGQITYVATETIKIDPPTGQVSDNAVVGWNANDDRWLSELRSNSKKRSSVPPQTTPSAAVQRPQWKPVR